MEWGERKLTLEDYPVSESVFDQGIISTFDWDQDTRRMKSKSKWNLVICYTTIRNRFLPDSSWIYSSLRTPQTVEYEQLKFDLSEVIKRRLEKQAYLEEYYSYSTMEAFSDSLNRLIHELNAQTNNGKDKETLDSVKNQVDSLLSIPDSPLFDSSVCPERRGWLFGLELVPALRTRTGSISNIFPSPSTYVSFEFSFGKGRLLGSAGMSAHLGGFLKSKGAFSYRSTFYPENLRCEDETFFLSIRYLLLDNNYFMTGPFAGIGITMFDVQGKDYPSLFSPHYCAGIDVNFKAFRRWGLPEKRMSELIVKGKLYAMYDNIAGHPGFSFNLGLGLGWAIYRTK